jgi:hypothetical protein
LVQDIGGLNGSGLFLQDNRFHHRPLVIFSLLNYGLNHCEVHIRVVLLHEITDLSIFFGGLDGYNICSCDFTDSAGLFGHCRGCDLLLGFDLRNVNYCCLLGGGVVDDLDID